MKKISLLLIFILIFAGCNASNGDVPNEINIEETARNLIDDLSNGEYKKTVENYQYTTQMNAIVTEKFMEEDLWQPMLANYGAFGEIVTTSASTFQGYDIISVTVNFEVALVDLNVAFDADKLIAGINTGKVVAHSPPQMPDTIEEIGIEFGIEGWILPGTLTVPKNGENLPALVLVHGSGPQDRDETVGPNKPFRDIAWALAEKGIATIRYDKRTFAHQEKLINSTADFTVYEETVQDAVLAFDYLGNVDRIDSSRIFIAGHSLGGMLIPRIAQQTPTAAGYVIMAGPVSSMEDLMVEQIKYLSELDGSLSDQDQALIATYENMRNNVKSLEPGSNLTAAELFGIPSSYWLDLQGYNPAEQAQEITQPLLIMQGSRDYQIPVTEYEMWMNELSARKNASFALYDGLNHLLIKGEGPPNPQEYNVPGQVAAELIADLVSFISK